MVESATGHSTSPPKCCTLESPSVSSHYSPFTMLAITTAESCSPNFPLPLTMLGITTPLSSCTAKSCSPDFATPAATTLTATATLTSIPSPTSEFHGSSVLLVLLLMLLNSCSSCSLLLALSSTPRMLLTNPILPHLLQRACMFLVLTTITLSPLSPSQATVFLHPILSAIAMYVITVYYKHFALQAL